MIELNGYYVNGRIPESFGIDKGHTYSINEIGKYFNIPAKSKENDDFPVAPKC